MAATGVRCTAVYRCDIFDFSETHIFATTTSFADAEVPFQNLVKARLHISGFPTQIYAMRMSVVGNTNFTRLLDISKVSGENPIEQVRKGLGGSDVTNAADQPKSCLTAVGQNNQGGKKLIYLAGIPDAIIGEDPTGPRFVSNGWYLPLFQAYADQLCNGKWGWIGRTHGLTPPVKQPILSIISDLNIGLTGVVVSSVPAGIVVGSKVAVSRVRKKNAAFEPINGMWTVREVRANAPLAGQNTLYLNGTGLLPVTQYVQGTGTVQLVDYSTILYSTLVADKQTTRKRGNRSLVGPAKRSTPKYISA